MMVLLVLLLLTLYSLLRIITYAQARTHFVAVATYIHLSIEINPFMYEFMCPNEVLLICNKITANAFATFTNVNVS